MERHNDPERLQEINRDEVLTKLLKQRDYLEGLENPSEAHMERLRKTKENIEAIKRKAGENLEVEDTVDNENAMELRREYVLRKAKKAMKNKGE